MLTHKRLSFVKPFLSGFPFYKSFLMALVVLLSSSVLYCFNLKQVMLSAGIGILLTAICDFQGKKHARIVLMFSSVVVNVINFVIINLLFDQTIALFLYLSISIFSITVISSFGERADLLTFSGLMGIVLSLIQQNSIEEIIQKAAFLAIGGCVYIASSYIFHALTKEQQIKNQLGILTRDIAEFMDLQMVFKSNFESTASKKALLTLHQKIIQNQQTLRELLHQNKSINSIDTKQNRYVQYFVSLIDIFELVTADVIAVDNLRTLPNWDEGMFAKFLDVWNIQIFYLKECATTIFNKEKEINFTFVNQKIEGLAKAIPVLDLQNNIEEVRPIALGLLTQKEYLQKMQDLIEGCYSILKHRGNPNIKIFARDLKPFLYRERYTLANLKSAFSLNSAVFRHSIRLTFACLIAYAVGLFFNIDNPYWIMLTVVVIMRPSFGLTKNRSLERVYGTIIGVIIAIGIVYLFHSPILYVVLGLSSMVLAFSTMNLNYKFAAAAITLNVVFVFALISPDPFHVIQYRMIDTLLGASIALGMGYIAFPLWEYKFLPKAMKLSIIAQKKMLSEIRAMLVQDYSDKNYRIKRKNAFGASSNLYEAYQRFTLDPKNKQKFSKEYYEWVLIDNNILSCLTNLGNFVKDHPKVYAADSIYSALGFILIEFDKIYNSLHLNADAYTASDDLNNELQKLNAILAEREEVRNLEISKGHLKIDIETKIELQYLRFLRDEVERLQKLTLNLLKISKKLNP